MRNPTGLLLSDDLIFTSRITGTARALGLTLFGLKDIETLLERAGREFPACVLLDLNHPGLELASFLDRLRAVCCEMPRVVGYGSHVEAETLRAARRLGCEPVLPRSVFVQRLETDLPAWLEP